MKFLRTSNHLQYSVLSHLTPPDSLPPVTALSYQLEDRRPTRSDAYQVFLSILCHCCCCIWATLLLNTLITAGWNHVAVRGSSSGSYFRDCHLLWAVQSGSVLPLPLYYWHYYADRENKELCLCFPLFGFLFSALLNNHPWKRSITSTSHPAWKARPFLVLSSWLTGSTLKLCPFFFEEEALSPLEME